MCVAHWGVRNWGQRILPWWYLAGIVCVNAYLCWPTFFVEYTGKMNSMHGFWIALARLAVTSWYKPQWWPYWFGGMPLEFTYAPGVPVLTAAISKLAGISAAHALNVVFGLVFCFGPAALFLMAWQLTGRAGWSFVAGAIYSVWTPTELIVPDGQFSLARLNDARRMYLSFIWDEVPHQLTLGLVAIAILFLARGFEGRGRWAFFWAGFFIATAALANTFGVTTLLVSLGCLLATCKTLNWRWNLRRSLVCGALAYLAVCPFLPPSLLAATRANADLFPESAFTFRSVEALALFLAGAGVLLWISRRWTAWHVRFFLLATYAFTTIVLLQKWDLHFIPQPGRYKVEMEFWLPLLAVFAIAWGMGRAPRAAQIAVAAWILIFSAKQVVDHQRFGEAVMQPVEIGGAIEYQTARWMEANLPASRVMAPGSIAQWMNAFSGVPQLTGGSYPTAPTAVGQIAMWGILGADDKSGELTTQWMKAYGVDAVIVSGTNSPEFWRPFQGKQQYEGLLPVLWNERDTRIYSVPRRRRSFAWVIPEAAIVKAAPKELADASEIRRYVAALDDAAMPAAEFEWRDTNRALIHASVPAGDVLSVEVTHHPGWKATSAGRAVPISRDGLGQMILRPSCAGGCEIELAYDGGWEGKLCRVISVATIFGVAAFAVWRRRAG